MAVIINNQALTPEALAEVSQDHRDWIYNGLDCTVTHEIATKVRLFLDSSNQKTYAFSRALQAPILEMSLRGTLVDTDTREKTLKKFLEEMKTVEESLNEILIEGVGLPPEWVLVPAKGKKTAKPMWRSPLKVKKLFYEVMGYKAYKKRNAQGRFVPSINREALEKLCVHFLAEPLAKHILKLRDLDKKRMFLLTQLDPDNRIRTTFNIAGTKTGRLNSSISDYGTGNNVQNVDPNLRKIFIPDPGYKFANLDLEQADARNVGAICWNLFVDSHGPEFAGKYLDACEGGDLHTFVTKMVWPELEWTNDDKRNKDHVAEQRFYRDYSYRDMAKRNGHGTNFLGTPKTMAMHLKVKQNLIAAFQHNYFKEFPCIKEWHKWIERQLNQFSYIETLLGRKRFFFGRLNDPKVLREATAYEPQSLTADQIDIGILNLHRRNHDIHLLIQVHDSILFQYPEEQEEEIIPWALEALKTKIILKRGREFAVPTEAKIGWNWGDFDPQNPEENPHGLKKWTGKKDDRTAPERKVRSLSELFN